MVMHMPKQIQLESKQDILDPMPIQVDMGSPINESTHGTLTIWSELQMHQKPEMAIEN